MIEHNIDSDPTYIGSLNYSGADATVDSSTHKRGIGPNSEKAPRSGLAAMLSSASRLSSVFPVVIGLLITMVCLTPHRALAGDSNLTRFTLPNGLRVVIQEDHSKKVVGVQYWVLVGSADEEESERGISHLMEHMAFKGTARRGLGQIAEEVEMLGGKTNAYTSWDRTVFYVTAPSDGAYKALDILTDAVFHPTMDPKELEKEKQVVLEEILEGEERPGRKLSKLLYGTAYTASPYKYPVIGYRQSVQSFTRDKMMEFRNRWYVPQNMELIVVGDVDPGKMRDEIVKLAGDSRAVPFFRRPRAVEPVQSEARVAVVKDSNTRETRMKMAFHIPSMSGADVAELEVLAQILGGGDSSRLVKVVKREKQLVHSISASSNTPKEPGVFVISATLDGKNLDEAVKAIMEEVLRVGDKPPSEAELARAKTGVEAGVLNARETVEGVAWFLGTFETQMGNAESEDNYLKLVRGVSAEEASNVARKYLRPPNVSLVVLMPQKDSPDAKEADLAKLIKEYQPTAVASKASASEEKVVFRKLANGIRVALRPDKSNPILAVRVAFLGGKRFDREKTQGEMGFVARMLDKGAGDLDENQIAEKIQDMGGWINGFCQHDSLGFGASFFSRNLEPGLELVRKVYVDPTFPESAMERERKLVLNQIRTAPDRPISYAVKRLNENLFAGHPYGFDQDGKPETIKALTRRDLIDAYKSVSAPSNTVITCVGDMDVDKTLAAIERLFGDIPDRRHAKPKIVPAAPIKARIDKTVRMARAKGHVAIGFRATTYKDADRYPLEVLNNVLSGMGGRLFRELRDKEALAYTVASFVWPGCDSGGFVFYMGTDASKVDRAQTGLFREIERVRTIPISDEELKRATTNLIGRQKMSLQSSSSRAQYTALNVLYGLGDDFEDEYAERISKVTKEQVLEAAKKYLDPNRAVALRIVPEKKS